MARWELLTEHKDAGGYYIGWRRLHPMIHIPNPMQPMGKASLVQISGQDGCYQVRGLTHAYNVLEPPPHKGLKLFDENHFCETLEEAQAKATKLKQTIAKMFDDITKSDKAGQLIARPVPI